MSERIGDELRAERRAADADEQHVRELRAARRGNFSAVHSRREILDLGVRPLDLAAQLRLGASSGARSQ